MSGSFFFGCWFWVAFGLRGGVGFFSLHSGFSLRSSYGSTLRRFISFMGVLFFGLFAFDSSLSSMEGFSVRGVCLTLLLCYFGCPLEGCGCFFSPIFLKRNTWSHVYYSFLMSSMSCFGRLVGLFLPG